VPAGVADDDDLAADSTRRRFPLIALVRRSLLIALIIAVDTSRLDPRQGAGHGDGSA
jgi:hypothetical protein